MLYGVYPRVWEGGGGRVGNWASYLKKMQIKHISSKLIR